ncbi:MAG: zinc metalloprotease HtpX [Candidatus Micrarchaeota archaeon]
MQKVSGLYQLETVSIITMGLVFAVVAGIISVLLWYTGSSGGIWFAIGLSLLILFIQWWFGPALIKMMTKAKEVNDQEEPFLHEVIGKLAVQANLPKPKVYVVENPNPNAFAFGRTQGSSGIAVHRGLLNVLDQGEIEAVLAHEMGHIKHRDVTVMTIASALPVMLYYIVLFLGSGNDRDRGAFGAIGAFIGAMFAQFLGTLLVLWLSRKREFYADAYSAYATGKPDNLMKALVKITYAPRPQVTPQQENSSIRAFYVAEPEKFTSGAREIAIAIGKGDDEGLRKAIEQEKTKGGMEFFMTHPLTAKRLESLLRLKQAG